MKNITKEEYIRLVESGEVIGLIISTMKPSYQIPVIFEFTAIKYKELHYLLTNKNPDLEASYDRKQWSVHHDIFISDVINSTYQEIIILNVSNTPDWEV